MAKKNAGAAKAHTKARTNKAASPKVTTVKAPPVEDPDRAPRTGSENLGFKERRVKEDDVGPNDVPEGEDRVFSVASRARWGNNESTHELMTDAADSAASAADNKE